MRDTKRKNSSFIFVIAIMAIFVSSLSFGAMKDIEHAQFEERVKTTNILMEKISQHVKTAARFNWDIAHSAKNILIRDEYENEIAIENELAILEEELGATFWLIDSDGQTYSTRGKGNEWISKDILITGEDAFLSTDIQLSTGEAKSYYLCPFDSYLQVGDTYFSHVVLVTQMNELDEFFDMGDIGSDGSVAFIIRPNGAQVYRHNNNNNAVLPNVYNVLTAFKQASFDKDATFEQFKQDIQDGVNNTIYMSLNGDNYYLAYYTLGIDDWVSLLIIPETSEELGTENLTKTITTNMVIIFVSMISLIVVLIGWFLIRSGQNQKEVNKQLQKAAEAEKAANLAKTNFLSSMSHDIRTPMNAIVGILTLAKRHKGDAQYLWDALNKIEIAANQLLTLINDILDISKIESGEVSLNEEAFSVHEFVNRITSIIMPNMEEKQHSFSVNMHDIAHDQLKGDKLRLSQVYLNLLSNAVKYTESGGKIETEIYEESKTSKDGKINLILKVKDNGMGISDEFKEKMYSSFSRATDTKTNKIQGSGLGLAICKRIVELMGGDISCDSKEGEGTTFTVRLSLVVLPDLAFVEKETMQIENVDLKGLHVLVVEDNNVNWHIAKGLLEEEGITTERAKNGQECLDLLAQVEENHFDAILMDVEMPVMNGIEATMQIRASKVDWIRKIPIFATTANAFAEDVKSCLDAGMNDHIPKPIDVDVLLKKLALIKIKQQKS